MSQNHKLAFTNTGSEKKQKNLCITPPQKFGIIPKPMLGTCTSGFPVPPASKPPLLKATLPCFPHSLLVREYLFQEAVLGSPSWEELGQPALSKPQFSILRFRDRQCHFIFLSWLPTELIIIFKKKNLLKTQSKWVKRHVTCELLSELTHLDDFIPRPLLNVTV